MKDQKKIIEMKIEEIIELEEELKKLEFSKADEFNKFKLKVRSTIIDLINDESKKSLLLKECDSINYTGYLINVEKGRFNDGVINFEGLLDRFKKYFERLIKYNDFSMNEDTSKGVINPNIGSRVVSGDGNLGNIVGDNNIGNTINIYKIGNDEIIFTKLAREELIKCDIDEPVKESLISELDKIETAKKNNKPISENIVSFIQMAGCYIGCLSNVIELIAQL